MIRINLLPLEDRPRRRSFPLPDRVSMAIYVLALLVAAAGGYSFVQQRSKLVKLADTRLELAQEEERLARQTKAIEQLELQTVLLGERLSVLQQLETHRFGNVEWMNAMNSVLPDRLWLQELTRNQGGSKTTLKGVADGFPQLSTLMKAMEESGDFSGIQLVKAERGMLGPRPMVFFTVSADWVKANLAAPMGGMADESGAARGREPKGKS